MGEIADYLIGRMLDGPDPDYGDEDEVVCSRCGKGGLYWQTMFSADGERSVLFEIEDEKPHVCKINTDGMEPA